MFADLEDFLVVLPLVVDGPQWEGVQAVEGDLGGAWAHIVAEEKLLLQPILDTKFFVFLSICLFVTLRVPPEF